MEGSPGQVAAGIMLGSCIGLTPLLNLHNLFIFALLVILNVSFGGGMLGLAVFAPMGFLLDPLFDRLGRLLLLDTPSLTPLWTAWYNTPGVPYSNFNNTVVLGSFVAGVILAVPIFFLARWGLIRYRATLGARVQASRFYQATPAKPVSGDGFAATLLRQVRQWSAQFDVPILQLTQIDTSSN